MSFIYNDLPLINKLIHAANVDLVKKAANGDIALRMAEPLLARLQKQVNPDAFPKNNPVSAEGDAQATTENLKSLGDFLSWAAVNKISWNGKRIAWNNTETHPQDTWKIDFQGNPIFAAKQELISYLSHLRDGEGRKNRVLQVMLGKIIAQVNEYLTSAGEKEIAERPSQENISKFDPNSVIDAFKNNELDPTNPFEDIEGYPLFIDSDKKLTLKDLITESSFMSWLSTMKIKGQNFSILNPQADPCLGVRILFQRAQYLNRVGKSKENLKPGYSDLTKIYLKAIQEFGSRVKGKDGKSCLLDTSSENSKKENIKQNVNPQSIDQIINSLPLDTNELNFVNINNFFTLYLQNFASDNYRAQAASAISSAKQQMEVASRLSFSGNQQIFRFTRNTQEFMSEVKPPFQTNALSLVIALQQVLVETGRVLGMFYNEYGKGSTAKIEGEPLNLLQTQILGDGSIYTQNLREILSLMSNIKSESGIKWTV